MMFRKTISLLTLLIVAVFATTAVGQRVTYKRVTVKKMVDVPVTKTRWVEETIYQAEEPVYKQVIQTEKRTRTRMVQRPKTVTKYRTERVTTQKPVTVRKFRERQTKQTTYKTVQGYRDQTYTVREPVVETEMRTERVTVQRPVTKELIEVQRTTTMKPVVTKETAYDVVPGTPLYQAVPDTTRRARIRLLSPGYYTDPATGISQYRRGGLHWVQPKTAVPVAQTPGYVLPREVEKVELKPEIIETRKPITVTRMVEETIDREVPQQVTRYVQRTETRKVPYEYQMPVDKVVVEKVPYTVTEYQSEVVEREIPFTVTEMETVPVTETYDVEIPRYVKETAKKSKPVDRWVEKDVTTTEKREIIETMKVPVGPDGEPLSDPVPLDAPEYEFISQIPSIGSSTVNKPVMNSNLKTTESGQQVYETHGTIVPPKRIRVTKPTVIDIPETEQPVPQMAPIGDSNSPATKKSTTVETSGSQPTPAPRAETPNDPIPETSMLQDLTKPAMPEAGVSEKTGDENAAD
jgi:hypothetical protein